MLSHTVSDCNNWAEKGINTLFVKYIIKYGQNKKNDK